MQSIGTIVQDMRADGLMNPSQVQSQESGDPAAPSLSFGSDVLTGAEVRWALTVRGNARRFPRRLIAVICTAAAGSKLG